MRSPTLAPSHEAVHFVLCDFGKLGLAYAETEPVTTETDVVDGILSGKYGTPVEVMAVNLSDDWARDVSEDVAGAVVTKARAEGRQLTEGVMRFAEAQLDEDVEPELVQR
jgi:hypothetical protein